MTQASHKLYDSPDFSLVLGGPLYQLYLRTRLARGGSLQLLYRRILAFSLITWLPLVPLSIISKDAWSGVKVPFLFDIDAHIRFLIALPLLIAAELIVHERFRFIIGQFLERKIVTGEEELRFRKILDSTLKLRNSIWVEIFLMIFVFTAGQFIWRHFTLTIATWYDRPVEGRLHLTPAGYWYAFVSIPIFQFILLRWYYRIALWYRLLWKVARLKLNLNATHPDNAGGLGFLGYSANAFVPIFLAHTVLLSGMIANQILYQGAQLPAFKLEMLGFVLFFLLVIFFPMTFFWRQLWITKREGMRKFGVFSMEYVREFQRKWFDEASCDQKSALGSSDIQSLADLANSFEVTRKMSMVPISQETAIRIVIILALPFVPLTLTMVPLDKLIDRFLGVLL
jgi:hypothetical protein